MPRSGDKHQDRHRRRLDRMDRQQVLALLLVALMIVSSVAYAVVFF
jgi:hypothetical protein